MAYQCACVVSGGIFGVNNYKFVIDFDICVFQCIWRHWDEYWGKLGKMLQLAEIDCFYQILIDGKIMNFWWLIWIVFQFLWILVCVCVFIGGFAETEHREVTFPEISTTILEKICQYFYWSLQYARFALFSTISMHSNFCLRV